jgi:hypothetical protein
MMKRTHFKRFNIVDWSSPNSNGHNFSRDRMEEMMRSSDISDDNLSIDDIFDLRKMDLEELDLDVSSPGNLQCILSQQRN